MLPALRIARHCREPSALAAQYKAGLGFIELGRFEDHDGFDGVMVGWAGESWHLEFVSAPHLRPGAPDSDDALVLYFPELEAWNMACAAALDARFVAVIADNPYWEAHGASFADAEGFRLILAREAWGA